MVKEIDDVLSEIASSMPDKIILSNRKKILSEASDNLFDESFKKISIVRKSSSKGVFLHIEKFTETQVFHENITDEALIPFMKNAVDSGFSVADSFSKSADCNMRITKKGKVLFSRHNKKTTAPKLDLNECGVDVIDASDAQYSCGYTCCGDDSDCSEKTQLSSHNRKKKYIIPEGVIVPALTDMGVCTSDGKIVRSMGDKFRQINKFLEVVDNAVGDGKYESLTVIDFGCGKSYLTFVLYYYFTEIKKIDVKMIGLDLKEDVIKKCNETTKKYGYENLTFQVGDINGFNYYGDIDMVVTLHACDTATDFALFNAIKWKTRMIFSVPCCQHEVNSQINSDVFSILTKYGLIKERVSALFTDAIRGSLLEACGYKTQMLEFIDLSHTPKNILIRAVRTNVSSEKKSRSLAEAERLMDEFSFKQTLYSLLKDENYI